MRNTSYIIRTMRGANVMAFDNIERAKNEKAAWEKRVGIKLQVVAVRQVEEIVA